MLNFLGITENFAVIENVPYSMTWIFSDIWTGEPIPLDGLTFTGKIFLGDDLCEIKMDIGDNQPDTSPVARTPRRKSTCLFHQRPETNLQWRHPLHPSRLYHPNHQRILTTYSPSIPPVNTSSLRPPQHWQLLMSGLSSP